MPPLAVPTYRTAGFFGSIWRSWMRPPVAAGPMSRNRRSSKGPAAGGPDWASIRAGANENATAMPMNPMAARRRYAVRMMAGAYGEGRIGCNTKITDERRAREDRKDLSNNTLCGLCGLCVLDAPRFHCRAQRIHRRDDGCPDHVDHRQTESPARRPGERKLVEARRFEHPVRVAVTKITDDHSEKMNQRQVHEVVEQGHPAERQQRPQNRRRASVPCGEQAERRTERHQEEQQRRRVLRRVQKRQGRPRRG